MMGSKDFSRVFLSYASEDKAWVRKFTSTLVKAGVDVSLDQISFAAGATLQDELGTALRKSDVFIVVLSPKSVESRWVNFEIGAAIAGKKRIIPILKAAANVPPFLRSFKIIEDSSPIAAAKHVASILGVDKPSPTQRVAVAGNR